MKTSFLYSIYTYIVILLPFVFCELSFFEVSNKGAISWLLLLLYIGVIIPNIQILLKDDSKLVLFTSLYIVFQLIYIALTPPLPERYNPYNKIFYVLFAFSGLAFWILGYKKVPINGKYILLIVYALILLMCYFSIDTMTNIDYASLFGTGDETFFFIYQILPYILLWLYIPLLITNSKIIKYGLGGILLLLLIAMLKRGPLVSLAFSLLFVIFANKKNIGTKWFVFSAVAFLIVLFIANYMGETTQFLVERFEEDASEGDISNHRFGMWEIFLENWVDRGPISILIGNGFESSHILMFRSGQNAKGAHNDFIELLYCYGILGFWVYSLLVYEYYKKMRLSIKRNYDKKEIIIFCFVIFFCTSFYSSNLTRFSTVIFGMYFYYYAGLMQRELNSDKLRKNKGHSNGK